MRRAFAIGIFLALLGTLLGAAMFLGAATSPSKPVMLKVAMVDYRFEPDHLTFQHDIHYQLHLENHGIEAHEFTAPTFFAAAEIDNPDVLNREHTEVILQSGETKDVFLIPHKSGTYDLRCADHDWNGMVGGITVD